MNLLKMYSLLKIGIFQPAMFDYRSAIVHEVSEWLRFLHHFLMVILMDFPRKFFPGMKFGSLFH